MIDIISWRVSIGLWHCHISPSPLIISNQNVTTAGPLKQVDISNSLNSIRIATSKMKLRINMTNKMEPVRVGSSENEFSKDLYCLAVLLLILSGDIEVNPGPKTGANTLSYYDLLRVQTANLSNNIAPVLYKVTDGLYAKGLIPRETKNDMLVIGISESFKASKLVNVLDTQLEASNDPGKDLINICHVLIDQHHQRLTDIGNTILQQLGEQLNPAGNATGDGEHACMPVSSPLLDQEAVNQPVLPIEAESLSTSDQPTISLTEGQSSCPSVCSLPCEVKKYRDAIIAKYSKYQPVVSDWSPPISTQLYRRKLLLIDKQNTHSRQWSMLRGNVDNVQEASCDTIMLEERDLVKPCDGAQPLKVVVDGPPGIGKTTLCRFLLHIWAIDEQIKCIYDLVLFCPLRDKKIAQADELKDLFFFPYPEVSKVIEWMEETRGKRILIIFDGWDELSTLLRQSSLPARIIKREVLDECSIVVTSRSYATMSLLDLGSCDKHVQVMGFSPDEVQKVIRETIEERDQAEKLIDDLKSQGDIFTLCYTPLVCSMVIYIFKLESCLPATLTELYKNIILQVIRRYIEKNSEKYAVPSKDICSIYEKNLPPDIHEPFKKLCHLSYICLIEDNPKITFSHKDLESLHDSGYLGLINENDEQGYQFLHLSIQEFLAAWWIANYETNFALIFKNFFDRDHFKLCLKFFAGLTQLKPHNSYEEFFKEGLDLQCKRKPLFKFDYHYHTMLYHNPEIYMHKYAFPRESDHVFLINNHDNESAVFLLQLLYESQNENLCSVLAQNMKNSLCMINLCSWPWRKTSIFDVLLISFLLKCSSKKWKHLDFGELHPDQLELINSKLITSKLGQSSECSELVVTLPYSTIEAAINFFQLPLFCKIEVCYVTLHQQKFNSFYVLVELLKLQKLKILHFISSTSHSYEIQDALSFQIQELIGSSSCKLKELFIQIDGSPYELQGICSAVEKKKSIKKFSLQTDHCSMHCKGILKHLFERNNSLEALFLKTDHLPLPNTVRMPIKCFALECSSDGDFQDVLSFISDVNLKCLVLKGRFSNSSKHQIINFLPRLQQLEVCVSYPPHEVIELFTMLRINTYLEALRVIVSHDSYRVMGKSLCAMLVQNKTIKYLEIEDDITYIYKDRIDSNSCSTYLCHLKTGLSHNNYLQELSLSICLSSVAAANEEVISLFNIISKIKNLTEFKVKFLYILDGDKNKIRVVDKENEYKCLTLFYEHGLPRVIDMMNACTRIRKLHIRHNLHHIHVHVHYEDRIKEPNVWRENLKLFYKSVFDSRSLEYVRIEYTPLINSSLIEYRTTEHKKLMSVKVLLEVN